METIGFDLPIDEDMHVHSTYSDGVGSLEQNVAAAKARGLRRLGCVDHVRADSAYVPAFVDHVRALRTTTDVSLLVGVEAKLLDTRGTLDLPELPDGVDSIYVADHQVPSSEGPRSPRSVREALARREVEPIEVIEDLVLAMVEATRRYAGVVLAHPFSVLPKCGIDEDVLDADLVRWFASELRATGCAVEVDERWRCPSVRITRAFFQAGLEVRASTDAHRPEHIGRYRYVRDVHDALRGAV